MLGYILRRLLATIPVMLTVAIFVFLLLRVGPSDPAAMMIAGNSPLAGNSVDAGQLEAVRTQLGLDKSLVEQFAIWMSSILRGDFGQSFFFRKSVVELIAQRVEPTLSLTAATMAWAVLIAVPLGVVAAHRHGSALDRCLMGFSVLGFSIPVFVTGYCLTYLLAIRIGWLPVQGYRSLAEGVWNWAHHLVLPSLTLAVPFIALIARMTRASMIEVLAKDYIRTARAKGLPTRAILFGHALRNAATPIITVIGSGIAVLIGGVVVIETVFSIPGLGRLTVEAVLARDYPVIQAIMLLFSLVYVLVNLLTDLAYCVVDPRIRY